MDNKIKELELIIEQQSKVIQELKENFFDKYDPDNKANHFSILLHFGTAAVNTNIINDYNNKIKKEINKIIVD